ncbi:hypothetical protein D3C76_139300 [compost metagenome]
MSDFMRTIVQEALRPSSAKRQDPLQSGSFMPKTGSSQVEVVPDIHRPNYQKDKRDQRLNAAAATISSNSTAVHLTREFIEQSMSPLLRMSLVQGRTREECNTECTVPSGQGAGAGVIGENCDGLSFWHYPELQSELFSQIGIRRTSAKSAGIVAAERCKPGYLFLLDEALGASKLEYEISWNKERGSAFQAIVLGESSAELAEVLQQISDQCEKNGKENIRNYISLEPSSFLLKYLGVSNGNSIAVWEGLSRYRSVALMDRALKQGMNTSVKYNIEAEYLLLTGGREELSAAIAVLQKVLQPYV